MSAKRRPGSDSPFSKLFMDSAHSVVPPAPVAEPVSEPVSEPVPVRASEPVPTPVVEPPPVDQAGPAIDTLPRRRGRPATGKRSDPNWLGRTFYINKAIDRQVEIELLKLKQSHGIELDKSELVNGLLAAWLQAQRMGQPAVSMAEILKIQRPQDPSA
jgi:hypothetical protein